MEYEWYEDSDQDDEESDITDADIKEEVKSVQSAAGTIKLSSDDNSDDCKQNYSDSDGSGSEGDALDAIPIYEKEACERKYLMADVIKAATVWNKLEKDLCIPSVKIEPPVFGNLGTCSVVLTLNISDLPDMIRKSWELGTAMTVSVIVDGIHEKEFRAFVRRPIVLARMDADKPSKFPVGECLINVVKPVITGTYSLEENMSPTVVGSFFSMLYEQLVERLRTLTEFCMVCGSTLYCGGLLPSICDGELCQYQYQELGLLEGLTTPRVSAPVLSLLMMAFNAASSSTRWKDILTPAPSARDRDKLVKEAKRLYKKIGREWAFVEGTLDIHSVLGCVMPCAQEILQSSAHYRDFKKESPSVAEFVEWLTLSNQSYLELVPPSLNVDFLATAKQFLFVADSPSKQAEFDALVRNNGGKTRYLFHGSRTENWHSIIRSGLKNMSGTKYQLAGAAHGNGIYLSNALAFSFQYCTPFDTAHVSENCISKECCMSCVMEGGVRLLAVVEVVDTPDAYGYDAGNIVVVKDEKWCSIRMLVAYSGNQIPTIDLNTMTPDQRKKIQDVVHMFKTADLTERIKHV